MGNLDSANIVKNIIRGTFSYLDAGGEQTILELADGASRVLCGGWLDSSAFTKNGTLAIYYKVDGTNYRLLDTILVIAATPCVFFDSTYGIHYSWKITWTEALDEGAARALPYDLVWI